jgi:hypothetical protein
MAIPEQLRVQKTAVDFIHQDLKPADLVCILWTSTGPLDLKQDFTDDRDALEAVVKAFPNRRGRGHGRQPGGGKYGGYQYL